MQRIPPAEFDPALEKRLVELWGKPPALYRALANHPAFVAAWTEFARAMRYDARTPRELRELVILRGAQVARSEYEWASHLLMARKFGVREAQIQALAGWRTSAEFDAREKAALELAEAVTRGEVSDAVYASVSKHFDRAEYVELTMVAAFYAMVSRIIDAIRVEIDAVGFGLSGLSGHTAYPFFCPLRLFHDIFQRWHPRCPVHQQPGADGLDDPRLFSAARLAADAPGNNEGIKVRIFRKESSLPTAEQAPDTAGGPATTRVRSRSRTSGHTSGPG